MIAQATTSLRSVLTEVHGRLAAAIDAVMADLQASTEWKRLPGQEQERLLKKYELGTVPPLALGTDEALLAAMDASSITERSTLVDAVPTRAARALEEAIRLLEPKATSFQVPRATLRTSEEVE